MIYFASPIGPIAPLFTCANQMCRSYGRITQSSVGLIGNRTNFNEVISPEKGMGFRENLRFLHKTEAKRDLQIPRQVAEYTTKLIGPQTAVH